MAIEEQIIEWSATRPAWQRLVLKRVAAGEPLSDKECDDLVDKIIGGKSLGDVSFGLEYMPQTEPGEPSVTLVSIDNPEHVNALESEDPLTFETSGLTIVYGDNGSGKSGYARLLKRITRARHQEDVLSDVFRDTSLAEPKAEVKVRISDEEKTVMWPESTVPELRRVAFYDGWCAQSYISTESNFLYRPSALSVMDGLIEVCVAIRARLDEKLDANTTSAKGLPIVDEDVRDTDAGIFLVQISGDSSEESLEQLIASFEEATESIDELKDSEARLQSEDTTKEKQALERQSQKLEKLRDHIQNLESVLGDEAVGNMEVERKQVSALQEASNLLAEAFKSEPVAGVGTTPWKQLWDSARRFSDEVAYPDEVFPVVREGAHCLLCQQELGAGARDRLGRFEYFVKEDTQTKLATARNQWDENAAKLRSLATSPEAIEITLTDLESQHADLVERTRELLAEYEAVRAALEKALTESSELKQSGVASDSMTSLIDAAVSAVKAEAAKLSDPNAIMKRRLEVTKRRKELELLKDLKDQRKIVIEEIGRLKERERFEEVKSEAATTGITKKILELSEENITEVVRDTFTRETDRLHLERVTIARTRGERGALLHQPKLVGARQVVMLPRVFSEGERTALGLAAFFTEAHLDSSKSAIVLDDPVSSLDHVRRGLVAAKLATLAQERQVVVFTHDVSFVADLKREARGASVTVAERSVTRSRGGERKPGSCTQKHPWKAKDVATRLDELRQDLARIKKESGQWDGDTYEKEVSDWAGRLSETWERIFSQEIVGLVLAEGGVEVRPNMVKVLARFSQTDEDEFQASYSRVSQWATRHDKSVKVNYVAPEVDVMEQELSVVDGWFKRVKAYKNQ